uniref:Costars family protein ABRACL n=1 Tax=Sus scrofa TaxID=9823 RepID=A0A8D1FYK8_PIG
YMILHSGGTQTSQIHQTESRMMVVRVKTCVKFGVLFRDDKCANLFEARVGTLKAAIRRKSITYPEELLLQGVHDDADIILLQDHCSLHSFVYWFLFVSAKLEY